MNLDQLLKTLVMELGELRLLAEVTGSLPRADRERLREAQSLISQVRRRQSPFTTDLQVG
jgi:hypothetical protein